MKQRVVTIIPAHNEEATIAQVVSVAMASAEVDEVIVVSDGSHDATAEQAKKAGARVIELFECVGKGAALRAGVVSTDAPILLFLDADLYGLQEKHLAQLIEPVQSGTRVMNVGLRDRGFLARLLGSRFPLISGERALRREVFEQIADHHLRGYMVEASLNGACRYGRQVYGSVFLEGLRIRTKVAKVGWWRAIPQYGKMWTEVLRAFWIVRAEYARGVVKKMEKGKWKREG